MDGASDRKKIYFASDFHFGIPDHASSLEREKRLVAWLDEVKKDASRIFLMGDIFDFWFEYRYTVPKGFIRLLGAFMEVRDDGIPVTFFTGNHDMWMFRYFQEEFGIPVYRNPASFRINDKKFLIGHGDGLGPGDRKYKIIKRFFENPFYQWVFKWIHPDIAFRIAHRYSSKSRMINLAKDSEFKGDNEWLYQYCLEIEKLNHHDYYIFGHRHLPFSLEISSNSYYLNIGDWIHSFTFGEFHDNEVRIKKFKD